MKKLLSLFLSLVLVVSMVTVTDKQAKAEEETTTQDTLKISVTEQPGEYVKETNTIYFNNKYTGPLQQRVHVKVTDETDPSAEYKFIIADPNIAMVDTDENGMYVYRNIYTPNAKGEGTTVLTIQKKKITGGGYDYWANIKEINLVLCDTPTSSVTTSAVVHKGETTKLEYRGTCTRYLNEVHDLALNPKYFTYSSSNSAVAKVDKNGIVTGKKGGKATITAVYSDGYEGAIPDEDGSLNYGTVENVGFSFEVTVMDRIEELSFKSEEYKLQKGNAITILPTVAPNTDYMDKTAYTFTSSNENVAKVSSKGQVSAYAVGDTTITATSTDGGEVSASYNLVVTASGVKNLKATSTINGTKLTWDANADAEEYHIYRRKAGETDYTLYNKSITNEFVDTKAEVGQTYEYYIVVQAKQGEKYNSAASQVVNGKKILAEEATTGKPVVTTKAPVTTQAPTTTKKNVQGVTATIKLNKPSVKVKVKKKLAKVTINGTKYSGFAVYIGKNKKTKKLYKITKTRTLKIRMKKKGKYYVRVRAYKIINGVYKYSDFSVSKKFKIKK